MVDVCQQCGKSLLHSYGSPVTDWNCISSASIVQADLPPDLQEATMESIYIRKFPGQVHIHIEGKDSWAFVVHGPEGQKLLERIAVICLAANEAVKCPHPQLNFYTEEHLPFTE